MVCVDVDEARIERLNRGEVPIHEPGLDALIKRNMEANRLEFTVDAVRGVEHGLFQIIAVGTPSDEDGSADLRFVLAVARTIGTNMSRYAIVINKSTVPVGTADKVRKEIDGVLQQRRVTVEFDVVSNPEFLKEGGAIQDCMRPDRVGHWHGQSANGRIDAPAVRPFYAQSRSTDRHGRTLVGTDKVRSQCDAGHQDQLHE